MSDPRPFMAKDDDVTIKLTSKTAAGHWIAEITGRITDDARSHVDVQPVLPAPRDPFSVGYIGPVHEYDVTITLRIASADPNRLGHVRWHGIEKIEPSDGVCREA